MAYNYFPTAYQNPYQQYYAPTIQPQTQQTTQAASGLIWVSGYQDAKNYPVAPNAAVALWDQANPVIYLKQADASGRPSIKVFDLVERKETAPAASSAPAGDYATKEELRNLAASMRAEIEKLTGKEDKENG